jgi:hypothetical protein
MKLFLLMLLLFTTSSYAIVEVVEVPPHFVPAKTVIRPVPVDEMPIVRPVIVPNQSDKKDKKEDKK